MIKDCITKRLFWNGWEEELGNELDFYLFFSQECFSSVAPKLILSSKHTSKKEAIMQSGEFAGIS